MPGWRGPDSQDDLDPRGTLARHCVPPGVLFPEEPDIVSSVKRPCSPGPELTRGEITVHLPVGISEGDCESISLNVPKEPVYIFLQFILS